MPYVVKTSSAHMPASVKSPYRHVAILEVRDAAIPPRMISERPRNVIRIYNVWRNLYAGSLGCIYLRQLREAEEIANRLNSGLTE
jgi:hypothetical protein